jgi:hypothetical protein
LIVDREFWLLESWGGELRDVRLDEVVLTLFCAGLRLVFSFVPARVELLDVVERMPDGFASPLLREDRMDFPVAKFLVTGRTFVRERALTAAEF